MIRSLELKELYIKNVREQRRVKIILKYPIRFNMKPLNDIHKQKPDFTKWPESYKNRTFKIDFSFHP